MGRIVWIAVGRGRLETALTVMYAPSCQGPADEGQGQGWEGKVKLGGSWLIRYNEA